MNSDAEQTQENAAYKDNSKTTDVFYAVLNNLESKHPLTVFKNVKLCLKFLKQVPVATPMMFFNIN